MAEVRSKFLDVTSKILCILVLAIQMILLDYIIVNLDKKASDVGRYIWIPLDVVILLIWTFSLIWSHRYFVKTTTPKKVSAGDKTSQLKNIFKAAIAELPFAYVCWGLYSIILVAKILRIFSESGFGEALPNEYQGNESTTGTFIASTWVLFTPTGIKIVLSMAGILFALLAYSHHNEIHNTKYKLMIDKLAHSASLDVLDCLMLLSYLFIQQSGLLLPFPMDHAIKAFTCLCILLPIVPLFALRYISNRQDEKTFQMVLVLNSALYLFLVNIPLFSLRIVLWIRHDADVTTFLTKNVMAIVRDAADVYLNVVAWMKDRKSSKKTEQTDSALGSEENETVEMDKVPQPARV